MKREVPKVHTSTVEVEGEGVCLRFCPLETALSEFLTRKISFIETGCTTFYIPKHVFSHVKVTTSACDTTEEDIEIFAACLQKQLTILDATVSQRDSFAEIVEAQDNMRLVTLHNWAGLGAVQYVFSTYQT